MRRRWCRDAADDIAVIDEAMRLGYDWKLGPFELIDQVGADWFAAKLERRRACRCRAILQLARETHVLSRRERHSGRCWRWTATITTSCAPEGVLLLADIKLTRSRC